MPMEHRAIVRRIYEEAWNKRSLELLDELVSPSHALQAPTVSGSEVGPEEYKRHILRILKAFPDMRTTIEDIVGDNEKIVVNWTFSGTHDTFMGIPQRALPWHGVVQNARSMRKHIVVDHVLVKLSGGRIVEATVKAIVDTTEGVRL